MGYKSTGFLKSRLYLLAAPIVFFSNGLSGLDAPLLMPDEQSSTPEGWQLVWDTDPGHTYAVQRSDNLGDWANLAGYPITAESVVAAEPIDSTENSFLRVTKIDEQGPEIVQQFPVVDDFAIPLNASISIELRDQTGVNWDSLSLTHSQLGSFSLSDPQIEQQDMIINFNGGGELSQGLHGESISDSFEVSDILGNTTTQEWKFD